MKRQKTDLSPRPSTDSRVKDEPKKGVRVQTGLRAGYTSGGVEHEDTWSTNA